MEGEGCCWGSGSGTEGTSLQSAWQSHLSSKRAVLAGSGGGAWAAGEYMLTEGSSLGAALSRSLGWWEQ